MQQNDDKKQLIIPVIAFLIGTIIGSLVTILFFPTQCNTEENNEQIEITDITEESSSTEKIAVEVQPIVSESTVSLPIPPCSITVDIAGAVKQPGVYCFKEGSKIVDAVKRASGFTEDLAYKYVSMKINLSSVITDHQKIYIPFEEDVYCEIKNLQYIDTQENEIQKEESSNNTSDSTQTCININTATKEQLTSLNGIGESTAQKIIDARPYTKTEDILNVSGIGESTYEKFKEDICVF